MKGDIFHMAIEDNVIIQLYFDRDENAIKATSEKYGKYCSSIAINILGNKEDAEECVNDTYLKTWNTIPPNRPSVLRTFLGKITRNLAFDLYKKMNAEKRGSGNITVVLDELGECVSGGCDPEQEYDKKECINSINTFLGTLSEEKCAFFVSRYWYAETIYDIAKRYGKSENYVSVSLNRIRKKLHEHLVERGFEV